MLTKTTQLDWDHLDLVAQPQMVIILNSVYQNKQRKKGTKTAQPVYRYLDRVTKQPSAITLSNYQDCAKNTKLACERVGVVLLSDNWQSPTLRLSLSKNKQKCLLLAFKCLDRDAVSSNRPQL